MNEGISPSHPEIEPRYDAVLVHGYWLSRSNQTHNIEGFKGSLRSRLATRAGADLYHSEGPMKLVFTGGQLKGPNYPATSELSRKEAEDKYGVLAEDIVTTATGLDTETESRTFESLAKEHGWKRVGIISFEQHAPSVQRFIPQIEGATIEHRSVEEILEKYDYPLVSGLAQRLKRSPFYGLGFRGYELAKTIIMNIPGGKNWLYAKNRIARTEKNDSKFNNLVTRFIDVYDP